MNCPSSYRQIREDLSVFDKVDMRVVAKEAVSRFNQRGQHSLCHYVVKDNKVAPHFVYCLLRIPVMGCGGLVPCVRKVAGSNPALAAM